MSWKTLNYLGTEAQKAGDLEYAEACLRSALAAAQSVGHPHQRLAISLNNLGEVYREQGRLDEAEALYRQAIEIDEARLAMQLQEPPRANQSRGLRRSVDAAIDLASDLNNLALLNEARGDLAAALELYERALELHKTRGLLVNYVRALRESGAGERAAEVERRIAEDRGGGHE